MNQLDQDQVKYINNTSRSDVIGGMWLGFSIMLITYYVFVDKLELIISQSLINIIIAYVYERTLKIKITVFDQYVDLAYTRGRYNLEPNNRGTEEPREQCK